MSRARWFARAAAAAATLAAAAPALAQGCAMCGTVGQGGSDPLVRGMYYSILLMVSMPFAVVTAVGGWFVYRFRRQGGAAPAGEAGAASAPVIDLRRP